ncbi:DUF2207 domain-containing protein [Evansella halocellulosilytica]|uniref:DUF2207 domain-containing protein n=1 Tax=Evansella halocellulosilytica TaxID=2011013 RepID=UPI000BB70C0B|nr:DUF2207 domain-containing protein [Evansella halocellulosilytica]
MIKRILSFFLLISLFLLFPIGAGAVDFQITDVIIEAELQENGDVYVREWHEYTFDGEFNGIIRDLYPKEGSAIKQLEAFENGNELSIESDQSTHRIHRSGTDETIRIELTYVIEDGVDTYDDVTQFHWPFFDDRNESDYENVTIAITPPSQVNVDDVLAYGRDAAYNTATIYEGGKIVYELGSVPSGTNGDIRLAYPADLFATEASENVEYKEQIIRDETAYAQQLIEREERQEYFSSIGTIIVSVVALLHLLIYLRAYVIYKMRSNRLKHSLGSIEKIPEEQLSLAATVQFSRGYINPHTLAATLLNLIRKGNIEQTGENSFKVNHLDQVKDQEKYFINWMFYEIGEGGTFSLDQLTTFTKKNSDAYQSSYHEWLKTIKNEIKEMNFYHNKAGVKILIGVTGLLITPFSYVFIINNDIPLFFLVVGLFIISLIFSIFYREFNDEGAKLYYRWKEFRQYYRQLSTSDWSDWPKDEQIRSYLYALSLNEKKLHDKNKELIEPFKQKAADSHLGIASASSVSSVDFVTIAFISQTMSSSFKSASDTTTQSSSGSSSMPGGGAGGGGGGSGAF